MAQSTITFQSWFQQLDDLLYQGRHWWQLQAFHQRDYPWQQSDLGRQLDALSAEELEILSTDDSARAKWLIPWIAEAETLVELAKVDRLILSDLKLPERLNHKVPGKKWQQICAFVSARPSRKFANSDETLLEWCAGKGHLGRVFSVHDNCSVTSLEWQQALCDDGNALARRQQLSQSFVCADAFSDQAKQQVSLHSHAVALHACGDLHTTLMSHWAEQGGKTLSISPCCYHLTKCDHYQPLSTPAQRGMVHLSRADLSLPLQQTVTAGATVRRRRDKELQWRLAFDEWQRDWRGVDEYLPVARMESRWLNDSFQACVQALAEQKQLQIPTAVDESHWLSLGEKRFQRVRRIELVSHLYRRPLELWLVLDRVLFLQERGAVVTLGEFCDTELTPRNLFIHADRKR